MFIFRHGGRQASRAVRATALSRTYASKIEIPFTPPPFPVVETCPSPTCPCRESPAGLAIDRETNINGSMAAYAQQVVLCTGRDDWKSRIEDDDDAVLVRQLKGFLQRGGKYQDPYHNVLITNSSFPSAASMSTSQTAGQESEPVSAYLLPSFQYIPAIPTEPSAVEDFIKAFVLPQKLHNAHDRLSREQKNILLREPGRQRQFLGSRPIDEILILICGHGGRDERCGTIGPILRQEFEEKLQRQNISVVGGSRGDAEAVEDAADGHTHQARIAMISHIGGHKFAGNLIVYIPPSFHHHTLAGKGIWYGRVGPEHVEGIVAKTVIDGKVIKELFRGGIDQSGDIVRL